MVVGFYKLNPIHPGRASHVGNCTYAVSRQMQGKGVGRVMVQASIAEAITRGYQGIQFSGVVSTNTAAVRLYRSEGFVCIGTVPDASLLKNGQYVDYLLFFRQL